MIEDWFRSLKHNWLFLNSLGGLAAVERLVAFYVQQHNEVVPSAALDGRTPDEVFRGEAADLVEQLREKHQVAIAERMAANRRLECGDCVDGFLKQTRYLILDRDPLYARAFRTMLKDVGVKVVRLPARSSDLNSYAERWVRSARAECLSRIIPLGEQHLRRTLNDYLVHYHCERNHCTPCAKGRLGYIREGGQL
jgi:hypothetical protein